MTIVFSPALRRELAPDGTLFGPRAEVVAADAREHADGKATAFVRLIAGLLGVGFDELRQRELQRRNRRLTLISVASVAGMMLTLGLALAAWRARGEALIARNEAVLARDDARRRQDQAEDTLAFMLGDFRAELKKVGQLALLEKVGNQALKYFDTANPRDLTDTALARHAKALSQIGEVRLEQKDVRYAEAEKVFVAAYQRAAALAARHPRDGDMLFERAQAEYWIGFTHLKRGELGRTGEWFTRYRDSATALVALDAASLRWRRELVFGHHNLAVLDFNRGDHGAARDGFLAEMSVLQKLSADNPADRQLQFSVTDCDSWLGSVAERSGDFAEARARFAAETAGLEMLVQLEPATAQWKFKLADSLGWEAEVRLATGELEAARERLARAAGLMDALVLRDPANRRWQSLLLFLQLREAMLENARGNADRARQITAEVLPKLEKLAATESQDRVFALRLMLGWRLEAAQRLAAGRGDAAEAAVRAMAAGAPVAREAWADDNALGEYAQACMIAGRIAGTAGQSDEAGRLWRGVIELLGSRVARSNYWRLLDPAARALVGLGRAAESQALIDRLTKLGYRPLEPWPTPAPPTNSVRNNNSIEK